MKMEDLIKNSNIIKADKVGTTGGCLGREGPPFMHLTQILSSPFPKEKDINQYNNSVLNIRANVKSKLFPHTFPLFSCVLHQSPPEKLFSSL